LALAVLILRIVLAAVFLAAALAKLASLRRTWARVRLFGIPETLAWPVAIGLPVTELLIAVLLIPDPTARAGGVLAAVALLAFIAAIARLLARGEAPDCNCFGLLHSSRVGPGMVVRNLVLAMLAGVIAVAGPGTSLDIAVLPWALMVAVAAVGVVAVSSWRDRTQARRRLGAVGKSAAD
jgi:uncharacterized membrane protein YphA (DoxX/SURF4 family)